MKNLQDKLANINKAKENTAAPAAKPVIQEAVVKKRVGRPTYKNDTVKYARIFADIPEELKDRMTVAMVQRFKGRFGTMSELINASIEAYLDTHE
jgi:predicted Zn-dependent protease